MQRRMEQKERAALNCSRNYFCLPCCYAPEKKKKRRRPKRLTLLTLLAEIMSRDLTLTILPCTASVAIRCDALRHLCIDVCYRAWTIFYSHNGTFEVGWTTGLSHLPPHPWQPAMLTALDEGQYPTSHNSADFDLWSVLPDSSKSGWLDGGSGSSKKLEGSTWWFLRVRVWVCTGLWL